MAKSFRRQTFNEIQFGTHNFIKRSKEQKQGIFLENYIHWVQSEGEKMQRHVISRNKHLRL